MRWRRRRSRCETVVSATELAEMGFCEKRVQLAHVHGKRMLAKQRRNAERGLKAHAEFHREGVAAAAATAADRRCFVATCLYGDSSLEAETLRRFRDEVLLARPMCRWVVTVYYSLGPGVCRLLAWLPWLQPPTRALVGALARAAGRSIKERR